MTGDTSRGDRIIRGADGGAYADDPRLSDTAKGLLARILRMPDDADAGQFAAEALIAAAAPRRRGTRPAIRELEAAGYRHRILFRLPDGRTLTRYAHHETPVRPCGEWCATCSGFSGRRPNARQPRLNGQLARPAETPPAGAKGQVTPTRFKTKVGDTPGTPAQPPLNVELVPPAETPRPARVRPGHANSTSSQPWLDVESFNGSPPRNR